MPHPEQYENLERVGARIGECVVAFCRTRRAAPQFHMDDLTRYVKERLGGAPDSPSRILRDLRQKERIDYVVVSRKNSLYRLLSVEGDLFNCLCLFPRPTENEANVCGNCGGVVAPHEE